MSVTCLSVLVFVCLVWRCLCLFLLVICLLALSAFLTLVFVCVFIRCCCLVLCFLEDSTDVSLFLNLLVSPGLIVAFFFLGACVACLPLCLDVQLYFAHMVF